MNFITVIIVIHYLAFFFIAKLYSNSFNGIKIAYQNQFHVMRSLLAHFKICMHGILHKYRIDF